MLGVDWSLWGDDVREEQFSYFSGVSIDGKGDEVRASCFYCIRIEVVDGVRAMAPEVAIPRPSGGRSKMKGSKSEGRMKLAGVPPRPTPLYSARNLDLCTQQLGHWNPFASSAGASPEQSFGARGAAGSPRLGLGGESPHSELNSNAIILNNPVLAAVPEPNCNCRCKPYAEPMPMMSFGAVMHRKEEHQNQALSSSGIPKLSCERAGSVHPIRQRNLPGCEPAAAAVAGLPSFAGEGWFSCPKMNGIDKETSGIGNPPIPRSPCPWHHRSPPPNMKFEVGNGRLMPNAIARSGLPVHAGRRMQGWSKRRKQLSHALVRGLWRWKDGFHARKRMKRSGPGATHNSGSDKSSDRAPYGVHASDPSTAPTSKADPFKWSDFPITPTDSSGELFYVAGGANANGAGQILQPELNSVAKEWSAKCCCCLHGNNGTVIAEDCDHRWLGNENNSVESGYGSEPGYRGDEELEFGDIDEQDEEEKEPEHLRIWREGMSRRKH